MKRVPGKGWFDLYQDHIVSTLDGTTDDMLFYVRSPSSRADEVDKLLEIFRVEDTKRPDFRDRWENLEHLQQHSALGIT